MNKKVFRNLDEQIEIFRNRGLVIEDIDYAKEILYRENYFFLNGYRHLFSDIDKEKFMYGTKFEELYGTFIFDRKIRNIIFKNLLIIENNVKSIMSYQLSKRYGFKDKEYLNLRNFNQDTLKSRQVQDVISKMERQIKVNADKHEATAHYFNNYGFIPMWVLVKVISYGLVAELYAVLKYDVQQDISKHYAISIEEMTTYLSILANFRNICAHEDILYDRTTEKKIPDTRYHSLLNIPVEKDEFIYGKNDLFAIVIIMKKMLTEEEFSEFIFEVGYEIDILDSVVDTVPLCSILNKIGFPDNWRDIIKL